MKYKDLYKKTIFIIANSLIMLILTYFFINIPFISETEEGFMTKFIFSNRLLTKNKQYSDSVIFVNVGFDRILVEREDENHIPQGNIDITDRKKLMSFFKIINTNKQYKYIVLDVFFNEAFSSKYDSLLVNEMSKTDRLLISKPLDSINYYFKEFEFGESFYSKLFFNNSFSKFQFLHKNNRKTIPLLLYERIDKKTIKKHFFYYSSSNTLCFNSGIIENSTGRINRKYDKEKNKQFYYDLGADLLNYGDSLTMADYQHIENLIKDKIVIIGDVTSNDFHNSFWGRISGPAILYNSYLHLKNNNHLIKKSLIIILFLIYLIINILLIYKIDIISFVRIENMTLKSVLNTFNFFVFFALLTIFIYYFYNIYLNILLMFSYVMLNKYILKLIKYDT